MVYLVEFARDGCPSQQWRLLDGKCYSLGRNETCSIVLPHISVSRRHALLLIKPSASAASAESATEGGPEVDLHDLGAVNGTIVNGEQVRGRCVLSLPEGTEIVFGENPYAYRLLHRAVDEKGVNVMRPRSCSPPPGAAGRRRSRSTDRYHRSTSSSNSSSRAAVDGSKRETDEASSAARRRHSTRSPRDSEQRETESSKGTEARAAAASRKSSSSTGTLLGATQMPMTEANNANRDTSSSSSGGRRRSRWTRRSPSPESNDPSSSRMHETLEKTKEDVDANLSAILANINAAKKKREEQKQQQKLQEQAAAAAIAAAAAANAAAGNSGLSVQEKRRLLWGKKKPGGDQQQQQQQQQSLQQQEETVADPNKYALSFGGDTEKKSKFLKLMGHKGDPSSLATPSEHPTGEAHLDPRLTQRINCELELQYYQGIRRKDGRKTGLGL